MRDGITEAQVDEARSVLRADYYRSVKAHAEDVVQRIKDGEGASRDDYSDALWEACNGSYWVIYTHAQLQAIQASDASHGEALEGLEEVGSSADITDIMTRWAFECLRCDVLEEVERSLSQRSDAKGLRK